MAEMIPEWFTQGPDVELQVWRALRSNLPEDWTVWHAVMVQTSVAPAEIDFLCYSAQHGLVAIEVKGGEISQENGTWFQEGRALKVSPYRQVARAGFALRDALCAKWGCRDLPFPFVKVVWFPAMERPEMETPEGVGCTLYAQDLAHPLTALQKLLPLCETGLPSDSIKQALAVSQAFAVSWQSKRSLADARLARLTLEQARALDAFSHFPQLRVQGCAGSGKTLLALRRAYQLTGEGKKVLLLCFNLLLAAHLRNIAGEVPGLQIYAVNNLFLSLLGRTDDGTPGFWRQLARDVIPAAEAYRESAGLDAVIVDEGQDFSPLVWEAVKKLVPARADFIIFYDPQQNIFQRDLAAMPHFPWPDAILTRNCRNTRAVCEVLRPHAPESMVLHEEAPAGETPEVYTAQNAQALRERLMALLVRLTEKESIPQHDIILMGAHAQHKMALDTILERFPKVRYFTYRKFKGLEAPVLILLDVNESDTLWDRAAHYTAISRAIHKLILLKLIPLEN